MKQNYLAVALSFAASALLSGQAFAGSLDELFGAALKAASEGMRGDGQQKSDASIRRVLTALPMTFRQF